MTIYGSQIAPLERIERQGFGFIICLFRICKILQIVVSAEWMMAGRTRVGLATRMRETLRMMAAWIMGRSCLGCCRRQRAVSPESGSVSTTWTSMMSSNSPICLTPISRIWYDGTMNTETDSIRTPFSPYTGNYCRTARDMEGGSGLASSTVYRQPPPHVSRSGSDPWRSSTDWDSHHAHAAVGSAYC